MSISELLKVGHAARKVSNLENAMLSVAMACKGLDADYVDQAINRANVCKRRVGLKNATSLKKPAYLLERMNEKTGEYEPYELMLETHCNIWEEDWNNPKFSGIEYLMLDLQFMEEFPNVIVTDGSDWDFRLGVMATESDVDANGGIYKGTAEINGTNDKEWKYRIRRVEVSGRPSKEFAKWLAEHPEVKWHC